MASALLISPEVRTQIAALIKKAAAQPTPLNIVMALSKWSETTGAKRNPLHDEFTMRIPLNYSVTYTHEHQRQCVCRHLSVALIGRPGRGPTMEAMNALLEEFGFKNQLRELVMWITRDKNDVIIEALEPLDGNIEQLKKPS